MRRTAPESPTSVAPRVESAAGSAAPATSGAPLHTAILNLQRLIGNRATRGVIQRLVQPAGATPGTVAAVAAPGSMRSAGLPAALKTGIERLSGLAMDDVRVHYGSARPATVGALAYTQGSDIHLGPGQEQHLPHEAWHAVQQKQGGVEATTHAGGHAINDDARLEREADTLGSRAARGEIAGPPPPPAPPPPASSGRPIQRLKSKQNGAPIDITKLPADQCQRYLQLASVAQQNEVVFEDGDAKALEQRLSVLEHLGQVDVARVRVAQAVNFGHQAAALTLVESLLAMGFHGAIEVVCDEDVMGKLEKLAPGCTQGADQVRFIKTTDFAQQQKVKGEKAIGLVAADDDAVNRMAELRVDSCLVLQPYAWHAPKRLFQESLRWKGTVVQKDVALPDDAAYVFDLPPPPASSPALQAFLYKGLASMQDKYPGTLAILDAVRQKQVDLMPVYGVHRLEVPEPATANLIGGVYQFAQSTHRPAVVLMLTENEVRGQMAGAGIVHTNIRTAAQALAAPAPGSVLFVQCGGLPQAVFHLVCQMATLPVVLEGANLANLMLMLGKPFISVLSKQTPIPEGRPQGMAALRGVEKAVSSGDEIPWKKRLDAALQHSELFMRVGRLMHFPALQAGNLVRPLMRIIEDSADGFAHASEAQHALENILDAIMAMEAGPRFLVCKRLFASDTSFIGKKTTDVEFLQERFGAFLSDFGGFLAQLVPMAGALQGGEIAGVRDALAGLLKAESEKPELISYEENNPALQAEQTKRFHGLTKMMLGLDRGARIKSSGDSAAAFDQADLVPDPAAADTIAGFLRATQDPGSETSRYFQEISAAARSPAKNQLFQGLDQMGQLARAERALAARPPTLAERVDHCLAQKEASSAFREIALARADELAALPQPLFDTVVKAVAGMDPSGVLRLLEQFIKPKRAALIHAGTWKSVAAGLSKDFEDKGPWEPLRTLAADSLGHLGAALWADPCVLQSPIAFSKVLISFGPAITDAVLDAYPKGKFTGAITAALKQAGYAGNHPLGKEAPKPTEAPKPPPPKPAAPTSSSNKDDSDDETPGGMSLFD